MCLLYVPLYVHRAKDIEFQTKERRDEMELKMVSTFE